MATSAPCLDRAFIGQLRNDMAKIAAVDSVCFAHGESAVYVWVGVRTDDDSMWQSLMEAEDRLSENHPNIAFDLHVIPLERGRQIKDYVSAGQQVFQRTA